METILKEWNNYLFEQIFNNDIEKFEYYEKRVVQGLVFDVLMRVGREIFKYGNVFFYFYPTSRNCGSENFNTWFLQKLLCWKITRSFKRYTAKHYFGTLEWQTLSHNFSNSKLPEVLLNLRKMDRHQRKLICKDIYASLERETK